MTPTPGTPNVCAIFLFNHRYEKNLAVLETLYAGRFSNRHYIMPFSRVKAPNVSAVFEMGHNFSGHLAQAARDFVRPEYTHYVIIADDLLLNPALGEANLLESLGLGADEGYIKNLASADALRMVWSWPSEVTIAFRRNRKALDLGELLPSAGEAQQKFESMGIRFPSPGPHGLGEIWSGYRAAGRRSRASFLRALSLRGRRSDYPFVSGYSDFLVIPAGAIEDFVRFAGTFAALNIFAEIAVPTALALACRSVRTELPLNTHFVGPIDERATPSPKLRGIELWNEQDTMQYAEMLGGTLDHLTDRFPPDWLYVHPVKLSRYA